MRMNAPYAHELSGAIAAARIAGDFVRTAYRDFTPIPDAPASISTEIDRGSQDLILAHLRQHFPHDGVCAEEATASNDHRNADAPRVWVVDPIDGTRGFVMKNGEFSIMIGLTRNRRPIVGVVYEPIPDILTYATLGGGTWCIRGSNAPQRCEVKRETLLAQSTLVQSHSRPDQPSMPVRCLTPATVREMYSAGVKMAVVARGEADVYANTYGRFHDWDICAGDILVTEAGGVVTGLKGEPITYGSEHYAQNHGLLAMTAAIADSTRRAIDSWAI
jgi:3'(2'), 5'-bisphosphate nucleotidase